jgi:hypothetical protein
MLIARLEGEGEGLRKRLSMQFSVEEEKWMLEQKLIETEAELKVHEIITLKKRTPPPFPPNLGNKKSTPRSSPRTQNF